MSKLAKKENYPIPEWKVEPNGLWVIFNFEAQVEQQKNANYERLRSIMND